MHTAASDHHIAEMSRTINTVAVCNNRCRPFTATYPFDFWKDPHEREHLIHLLLVPGIMRRLIGENLIELSVICRLPDELRDILRVSDKVPAQLLHARRNCT